MKKFFLAVAVLATLVGASSCSSIRHSSTTIPVETKVVSTATAQLAVSQKKISYKFYPSASVRRTGEKAAIKTAVAQALKENGDADVLVAFQYEIKKSTNIFGKTKIKYIIVEGYPATYQNISPLGF